MRGTPYRVLLAVVLVLGCHKPAARRFSDRLAAMRDKLVTIVKPAGSPGTVNVDLKTLMSTRKAPPRDEPRNEPRDEPHDQPPAPAPTPSPAPAPNVNVTRVDASRPTVFVLRGQTHGGKDFCETHTTIEACNAACTSMLRQNAFTKPDANSPKGCACTELDKGC